MYEGYKLLLSMKLLNETSNLNPLEVIKYKDFLNKVTEKNYLMHEIKFLVYCRVLYYLITQEISKPYKDKYFFDLLYWAKICKDLEISETVFKEDIKYKIEQFNAISRKFVKNTF